MEITFDSLSEALGEDFSEYPVRFDENRRLWLVEGKKFDLLFQDLGNDWCRLITFLPKDGKEREYLVGIIGRIFELEGGKECHD